MIVASTGCASALQHKASLCGQSSAPWVTLGALVLLGQHGAHEAGCARLFSITPELVVGAAHMRSVFCVHYIDATSSRVCGSSRNGIGQPGLCHSCTKPATPGL